MKTCLFLLSWSAVLGTQEELNKCLDEQIQVNGGYGPGLLGASTSKPDMLSMI